MLDIIQMTLRGELPPPSIATLIGFRLTSEGYAGAARFAAGEGGHGQSKGETRMQQLIFIKPAMLEWHEVSPPRIEKPREAIVRPIAVSNCDLDTLIVHGMAPMFSGPFPFAHEFVAQVVETGDEVRSVRPGDVVSVAYNISCGECARCRKGLTASCTSVTPGSMYGTGRLGGNWGGALSDLVKVPFADSMLVAIPHGVSPTAVASLSDNLPDAWRTVAPLLDEQRGKSVLIVGGGGAGSVGLYAVAIAKALGAERIDYLDGDAVRLELARKLGGNPIAGPPPRKVGSYAITVDASLDKTGLACAIRSTESEGFCTSVGTYFSGEIPVPLFEMFVKGVTFKTGRAHARAYMEPVLALIQAGRLHPELVTDRVVPWEEAIEALAGHRTKLVIVRELGQVRRGAK
jgi:alcohol dehydrogenase